MRMRDRLLFAVGFVALWLKLSASACSQPLDFFSLSFSQCMLCSHYLTFATVSRGSVFIQLHTVRFHVFAPSRLLLYTTHSRECNFWMNRAHSDAKCTKNKHYSADTHTLIFDSTVSHKIYTRTLNVAVEFRESWLSDARFINGGAHISCSN